MAGSKSDAFEIDVLKAALGQATTILTTTVLAEVYLALFTGAAAADGPGTEATGGGYARKGCKASFPTVTSGTVTNNAAIAFTAFTGSVSAAAPITHFALMTAATGGSALYWGTLTDQTKVFSTGDTANFPIGSISLSED
jgi:hypothetical protein